MTRLRFVGALCVGVVALCGSVGVANAQTFSLLTNGNFETGTFAGWTRANVRDASDVNTTRNFYIDTPGTTTPENNTNTPPPPSTITPFATAGNASGGNFYAVSTSEAPGQSALIQNFVVPDAANLNVTLTFQMFVNDQSGFGGVVDSSGLDYTTGGAFRDNQHARVDILSSTSSEFTTMPGDVVRNFYLGADGVNLPAPYVTYTFDITANVVRGATYRLRFAEVDNLSALNVGVDNVAVTAVVVPEPGAGMLGLMGLVLGGYGLVRRRYGNASRKDWTVTSGATVAKRSGLS